MNFDEKLKSLNKSLRMLLSETIKASTQNEIYSITEYNINYVNFGPILDNIDINSVFEDSIFEHSPYILVMKRG